MLSFRKLAPEPGLSLVECADLPEPAAGQVLIDVQAVGICGSDLHVQDWSAGYDFMVPHLPLTLGHEFAGTVAAVGPDVGNVAPGDRVTVWPSSPCGVCPACMSGRQQNCRDKRTVGLYSNGAFAPQVMVRAQGALRVDDALDFEIAALAEPLCVGHRAVMVGEVQQGDRVVVLGPGTIGQAIALSAREAGAAHITIAGHGDAPRLAVCRALGFDATIDLAAPGAHAKLAQDCAGSDIVFEATGRAVSVTDGLALLRPEGILVMTGIHAEPVTFEPVDFVRRKAQIRASHGSQAADWAAVIDMLGRKGAALRPMITHRLPLAEIDAGFDLAHKRAASKVMIFPSAMQPTTEADQ
jgi:2-desacetyl-2-hydroxyethyl bacteriochlorophyllide A dehydrogenase